MTTESNKALMQRFTQFINTASEELAGELISPDAIFHVPGQAEPMRGPAGYLAIIGMMRGGFPDIQWTLEETIAEGDKVAARFTMRGTHKGTFYGVPPTGKKIEVKAMNICFANGKILEEHGQPDLLGLHNKSAQCRRRHAPVHVFQSRTRSVRFPRHDRSGGGISESAVAIRRRIWRMTMQRHACHEPSLLKMIITNKNNRK